MATVAALLGTSLAAAKDLEGEKEKLAADTIADQAAIDAGTTLDANAHADLIAAVIAKGPTVVNQNDGTFIGLIPQADGTVTQLTFKDGSLDS